MFSSIREIAENIKNSPCFNGSIEYSAPLKDYTTMKVGGPAEVLVSVNDTRSALFVLRVCRNENAPVFILGGGSNLIVNDSGIKGFVLRTSGLNSITMKPSRTHPFTLEDYEPVNEAEDIFLSAGSGCTITELCSWCERYGIYGLDKFSGLPGTIGGACFMNARCYESNIGDFVTSVKFIDLDSVEPLDLSQEFAVEDFMDEFEDFPPVQTYTKQGDESSWSYKHSPFQDKHYLITEVELKATCLDVNITPGMTANPGISAYIRGKNLHYVDDRREKGHFKAPSAGSVFKNNREFGKPSGKLIDEVGLKGKKIGGAQVAPWHGNFIINTGDASAEDIKRLVDYVKKTVSEQTGCLMEEEIIFV